MINQRIEKNKKIQQPKILTIDASQLFKYYAKRPGEKDIPFCFDVRNKLFYGEVVKQLDVFDECPLLYQIMESEVFKNRIESAKTDICIRDNWLLDKLIIVDFSKVFIRSINPQNTISPGKDLLSMAKDIIENGFDILFSENHKVHMMPFDKSGNMSRHSRITFLNEDYLEELNTRLNLDIDFSKMNVILSKFYAYRGLYLTSSKRVEHKDFIITPETLVIIKDKREYESVKENGKRREVLGPNYEKNVPIITAKKDKGKGIWEFTNPEIIDYENVATPFDGVGVITPKYAQIINNVLSLSGATSFQIRMPFVKGMLHQVDFKQFLEEFDEEEWKKSEEYYYEDAFGIKRDLKKAEILITESMFKCEKWLKDFCNSDPMEYYCDKIKEYGHALYVSGTDLPYGHSEYTHLTYQMINTLNFSDKEFHNVQEKHRIFLDQPKEYLTAWDSSEATDYDKVEIALSQPSWKKALKEIPDLENDNYISEQLKNTQKGLLTKIANGKLVVPGQTRFLCRDLLPFLARLIKHYKNAEKFFLRCLYNRAFIPMPDEQEQAIKRRYPNLKHNGYIAFFRSPHLSRNEQCVLQPFTLPSEEGDDIYTEKYLKYEKFTKYVGYYKKYFGHLTGVVMVPRGSIVPMCLGGADFDGDLVNIVYDENVVNAVIKECYSFSKYGKLLRKKPVIKIPSPESKTEPVPKTIPYDHIENTFSNAIGYLSNKAVSIGQKEYAEGVDISLLFGADAPACWKCTILTGLEIDAAKNGQHPDLSAISRYDKNIIPDSTYIAFKKKYGFFRKITEFDQMEAEIGIGKEGNQIIRFKNTTSDKDVIECDISPENYGTKINKLPYIFAEEFNKYKNKKPIKPKGLSLEPMNPSALKSGELPKLYLEKCSKVFHSYKKYERLYKSIRSVKNKSTHGETNLTKLIAKKYDSENEKNINEKVLPELADKINRAIPREASIEEIKKRINEKKWQFQPDIHRSETLESIIGNGFRSDCLTDGEKELLFHFGQYGYKMLWHVLTLVKDSRMKPYEELKEEKDRSEIDYELDNIIQQYYESNLVDAEGKLYHICLNELKKIIEDTNLPVSAKICLLYELTFSDVRMARFFWDSFSWEDLKSSIENKEIKLHVKRNIGI